MTARRGTPLALGVLVLVFLLMLLSLWAAKPLSASPVPLGSSGARWINIPHPVAALNVVEWEVVNLPRESAQTVELLAVECWMEPPYLEGMNAGHTKCGVLMRGDGFPSDEAFHASADPDIVVILSVAGFKTNPWSNTGQGVGLFQEWVRWQPPVLLEAPPKIAIAFNTTNPGATLHARVWYRIWGGG